MLLPNCQPFCSYPNVFNDLSRLPGHPHAINPLRPRQNGRRFADDTLNRIFLNENVKISIKISLKFAPKGPINNIPALVQIMAWRRPGDKPMMVSSTTHICVTRPQWVNWLWNGTSINMADIKQNFCNFAWTSLSFNRWACLSEVMTKIHHIIKSSSRCHKILEEPFQLTWILKWFIKLTLLMLVLI